MTIYYDVTINNDINIINSDEANCGDNAFYKYENGVYTDKSKYEFNTKKVYHATKKSSLFKGTYYSLELAN